MKRLRKYYPLLIAVVLGLVLAGIVLAAPATTLPVSKGVYRLPYENMTDVQISNDHTTHPEALNRLDMRGQGVGTHTVVAAGAGWIRFIVEDNDTFCPNVINDSNGDGIVTSQENQQAQNNACNGYSGPSSFCCERDFETNGGVCPGVALGATCTATPNNFVWIEHPNGEWTKYTHMQRGSVGQGTDNNGNSGAGRVVSESVEAGTPLGIEGDVGLAGGPHVHFEVAVPNDPDNPINAAGFLVDDGDGDGTYNRQNRIPVFCDINFPVLDGDMYTAEVCQQDCASLVLVGLGVNDDEIKHIQAHNEVQTLTNIPHVVANGGGEALRAGQRVVLNPGFHAEQNSFFSASIGACDTPGAN